MMAGIMRLPKVEDVMKTMRESRADVNTALVDCPLAVSYGKLPEQTKSLDERVKTMIGIVVKTFNKKMVTNREEVINSMMQNPVLEPMEQTETHRMDKFTKPSFDWFKFRGSQDQSKISEVEQWIKALIRDNDVIENMGFCTSLYAMLVEHTGVHMSGLRDKIKAWFSGSSSSTAGTDQLDHNGTCEVARNVQVAAEAAGVDAKSKYEESKMMNFTCLQYPDSSRSYFKVYTVQLKAWSNCSQNYKGKTYSHGIIGDFYCRTFKPRDSIISELKDATKQKAMQEAEDMFTSSV